MKKYLITFADSRYSFARLKKQAEMMNYFDSVVIFTEKNLDKDFKQKHKAILKLGSRGYGYWIWKPYIIHKMLQEMNAGDFLLYIDAGCHLNPVGRERLIEYFDLVTQSELKIGGFQIEECHNEKRWSKMDLLVHLGVENNKSLLESGQICATHVILQKCEKSEAFVKNWLKISENHHYIDDSPSIHPESKSFRGHRHDQSIFSIMCKLEGAVQFPGDEVYPRDGVSWELLQTYPIHDRRDRSFTFIGKLMDGIIRLKKKISHFVQGM